jgi:PAS domain S-box-containing protein
MFSSGGESVGNAASDVANRVEGRFGVLPNFFCLAAATPEIIEKLWGFAQAAYLDNPLPSIFKERLFVHLSRFCAVRYCIARHVGFLVGLGRPAGDPTVRAQSVTDVVSLLRRPFPRGQELQSVLSLCEAWPKPVEMPVTDAQMEDAIFVLAAHVFLKTSDYLRCLDVLACLLGPVRLQYLLLFLAFVRAAHYWTETHPEIAFEEDIDKLLATHEELAECILHDPEARDSVSQSLLDELPALRLKADRAIGLLAAIVDSSDDAIVSKTLEGIVTSWNATAERIFGYTASEAIGQHISLIIPVDRRDEETAIIERIKKGERIEHFDTVRVRKDKTPLDISLTISPVRDASGKVIGASKIARDITQRKEMERAVRESEERYRTLAEALDTQVQLRTQELESRNSELRDLSGQLMKSQDVERRRIARELHDSAGQLLTAVSIDLSLVAKQTSDISPRAAEALSEAAELVQRTIKEIRIVSHLLHPPLLDQSGLASALSEYLEGFSDRAEINMELVISKEFGRLPVDLETALFRIIQECLTNIHRHSGSQKGEIRLTRSCDEIRAEVSDEGRGIPAGKRAGVGLRGMKERVGQFGGRLEIVTSEKGTTVIAKIPLKTPLSNC